MIQDLILSICSQGMETRRNEWKSSNDPFTWLGMVIVSELTCVNGHFPSSTYRDDSAPRTLYWKLRCQIPSAAPPAQCVLYDSHKSYWILADSLEEFLDDVVVCASLQFRTMESRPLIHWSPKARQSQRQSSKQFDNPYMRVVESLPCPAFVQFPRKVSRKHVRQEGVKYQLRGFRHCHLYLRLPCWKPPILGRPRFPGVGPVFGALLGANGGEIIKWITWKMEILPS